jgi:hypothetical protein
VGERSQPVNGPRRGEQGRRGRKRFRPPLPLVGLVERALLHVWSLRRAQRAHRWAQLQRRRRPGLGLTLAGCSTHDLVSTTTSSLLPLCCCV